MATKKVRGLFERPAGSGVWWIRYADAHGKEHREKIGAKGLAKDTYQKRKADIRAGRFSETQIRVRRDPLFADYAHAFVQRRLNTYADPATPLRYARYFAEAPESKGKSMRELKPSDFEAYRDRRLEQGVVLTKTPGRRRRGKASWETINKELSFARSVFNTFNTDLEDAGLPPIANPVRPRVFATAPPERVEAARTRWLTPDEEAALEAVMRSEDWTMVAFAKGTGIDRGAQCALRWAQVDFTTRTITTTRRKGGRRREPIVVTTYLNDALLALLRALPSRLSSPFVFPSANGTMPTNGREFVRTVFRPALRRAGITDFRWKDLRHTFATRLRLGGADTGTIRELLGHTTERMTKRYAHANASHLLAAVQALDTPQRRQA